MYEVFWRFTIPAILLSQGFFYLISFQNSMSIVSRKMEIRMLIANANVDKAIIRAMDFVNEFSDDNDLLNEVTVHCGGYNRLNKEIRQNIISYDEADIRRNKLLLNILNIIDDVERTFSMMQKMEAA